jgi:arylsulfatase A-like enzyme
LFTKPCLYSHGQYAHTHTVVDNESALPKDLVFFPKYMQQKVIKTAFMGKWHMGNTDDQPQPGFGSMDQFPGAGCLLQPGA